MSLIPFEDVRPWAKSIRTKVAKREMPPWGADPQYGKFKDDRSLSAAEIETITKWVDDGAPKGDAADLPQPPAFADGWSHGEPDVVTKSTSCLSDGRTREDPAVLVCGRVRLEPSVS